MEWKLATPGLLLTLTLIAGCWYWYQKRDKNIGRLVVFSLFGLFLTMDAFPWNFLETHTILGSILSQIQFPHRFLHIADLILCLLLGSLLCLTEMRSQSFRKISYAVTAGLNLFFLIFFLSDMATGVPAEKKYEFESLDNYSTSYHYLPVGASTDRYAYSREILKNGVEQAEMISRKTHNARIRVSSKNGGTITLPILNYPGYRAMDSMGNVLAIRSGENSRITVDIPEGFDGELYVEFKEPVYWTVSIFISIAGLITTLIITWNWRKNFSAVLTIDRERIEKN